MAMAATELAQDVADRGDILPFTARRESRETEELLRDRIYMLEQVRKTYDDIPGLANDFADKGMTTAVFVALLTPTRARRHLELVNEIWGTAYKLNDFRPYSRQPRRYAFLIAGHRRMHGHDWLWQNGCDACREEYGQEVPGVCYARHPKLDVDLIKAQVWRYISPEEAQEMQSTENIHRPVPAHEQAGFYDRLLRVYRRRNPELTLRAYARKMGAGEDTIRRHLRYCVLPEHFKADVEASRYSFGVALELGRFVAVLRPSNSTLDRLRQQVIQDKLTVKQLRKIVDRKEEIHASGAVSLGGFEDDVLNPEVRKVRRAQYEGKLKRALDAYAAYLKRVQPLLADGTIGPNGTYLDTGTRTVVTGAALALEAVLPDLRFRLEELEKMQAIVNEVKALAAAIDAIEVQAEPELFAMTF